MAGVELAGQMAILEEALQRLEGELARDPAWYALQADAGLDDAARTHLMQTLEANPVYRAWRNMQQAAAMLQTARDGGPAAGAVPISEDEAPAGMAATLAQALQQLPPDDTDTEARPEGPEDVAQVLAAQVAAQTTPRAAPLSPPHEARVLLTAEEREAYDVGRRATQAVERILTIPVIAPIAPRSGVPPPAPAPLPDQPTAVPPAQAAAPLRDPTDEIGHSVPLEAEDLAFLLTPAVRPATAERPFLKRLVAEAQSIPTKATLLAPADPFMVPPAPSVPTQAPPADPEAPPSADAAPDATDEAGRKPRLARLLRAWSRH